MGRHFEAMPRDGLGVVLPPVLPNPLGVRGGLNMGCFSFDGSSYASIMALSENLIGGGGSFTVSWKAKCIPFDGSYRAPMTVFGNASNYMSLFAPRDSNQLVRVLAVFGGTLRASDTSTNAPTSWAEFYEQYDHAAGVYKLYISGILAREASVPAFDAVDYTLFFLGSYVSTYIFKGQLADIRVYNAVVTPDHTIPATSESNVVDWWITPKPDGSIVGEIAGNTLVTTGNSLYSASGGPGLPWWPS